MLHVRVLGRVRAWAGDREIDLGPARQRALFAVLATSGGRVVGRDELIEAVWGTAPPATAAGSVYTYVSGLRRAIEPDRSRRSAAADLLTSGPSGYALRPAELDAEEFQRLRTEAVELFAAGRPAEAVTRLDDALALWHGDAYAGLAGPFVELDRERLADQRLATVEQRARALLDLDPHELADHDGLVGELTGLVRDHPLRETLAELLIRALVRAARPAEALEVFRSARRSLVDELGVEPGPALQELHRQVLSGSVDPAPPATMDRAPIVMPTPVARALRDGLAGRPRFGLENDIAYLRGLVGAVTQGAGGAVWIDGEPGIGKTELLTHAFADAADSGCQLAWGAADELGRRVPLQLIGRALGLESVSRSGRLAALAAELHEAADDGGPVAAANPILAYVRTVCAVAPMILVVDDMQWADTASVLIFQRLLAETTRLPLLLVAAARPEPQSPELSQVRRSVQARQRRPIALRPLSAADLERLMADLAGAPVGANLQALATRSAGNPLYAREMVAALLRSGVVRTVDGVADVDAAVRVDPPESLLAAVRATVDFLSDDTQEVLRLAALLGTEFAVGDVVALTGRSPSDLMAALDEALAANVVVDAGRALAFRHPFLRQALAESMPVALRAGLHRHAAEVLAAGGSAVTRVAEQLAAAPMMVDAWVAGWLAEQHAEVARQAPQLAGDLIRRTLDTTVPTRAQRETLLVALVKVEFRQGRHPMDEAARAMELATDVADRAEMRQVLATMRFRHGDTEGAIVLLRDAVDDPRVPPLWRARHRVLLGRFHRGDPSDLDRALDTIRETPDVFAMHFDLLDNRMFPRPNLDRPAEAEQISQEATRFGARHQLPAGPPVAPAVRFYWLGRWDEAMVEIGRVAEDGPGITFHGTREPGALTMLLHGVAALIAVRRGRSEVVAAHLAAAEALPATDAERESCDFLLMAKALQCEQQGNSEEALRVLTPLLTPEYAPMAPRHPWLPDAIRLASAARRPDVAERAAAICAGEAAKEVRPARASAAAARCRALITGDPASAMEAAAHYRAVGRVPELAAAMEDAAVLLAATGRPVAALRPAREATRLFTRLGGTGDLARMRRRLAEAGVESYDLCRIA